MLSFAGKMGAAAIIAGTLPGMAPSAHLDVSIAGLRSQKGVVRLCLTRDPAHFPNCDGDPAAHRLSAPVADAGNVVFADLPSGEYAIALFHDENANARLDTFAGIPREGVGFSRNPRLSFGPPRFAAARFAVTAGASDQQVRLKYFL